MTPDPPRRGGDLSDEALVEALDEWARLFNAGAYFEAHEVLEHPWLRAAEPRKTLLKGLIHAAVALYQYGRGNAHGARVKYGSCLRYLAAYHPRAEGVEVSDLTAQMERFFAPLAAQPPGPPPPPPGGPWPRAAVCRAPAPPAAEGAPGEPGR